MKTFDVLTGNIECILAHLESMLVAKILNMGMGFEIDEELKKYFFDFWKVIK